MSLVHPVRVLAVSVLRSLYPSVPRFVAEVVVVVVAVVAVAEVAAAE